MAEGIARVASNTEPMAASLAQRKSQRTTKELTRKGSRRARTGGPQLLGVLAEDDLSVDRAYENTRTFTAAIAHFLVASVDRVGPVLDPLGSAAPSLLQPG
jgi:hypothetical protein